METPTKHRSIVAYLRVSTSEQGKSGLGLEAQQDTIQRFAEREGITVVQWFREVESGKGHRPLDQRPILADALKLAKKLRVPLVISKLDRLSRDLAFISGLMAENVRFIALDVGKDADPMQVHISAMFAENERRKISQRTIDALAALKRRGVILGNPNRKARRHGSRLGAETNRHEADIFAKSILPHLRGFQQRGMGLRAIAEEFNRSGIRTARGGSWTATQLSMIQRRVGAAVTA